ncbi:interferon-related developmental regulator-domain-containing protein [Calycina marina]|uniref:Interferon-related developmental regulator-domain-containing protein n=1 Tax=Calycina marina TaxID=1763456 RepID=A0A9P7Z101_9HELO|nr:interferon-related developmental regulator-domain-containing protein [Calycina marina]
MHDLRRQALESGKTVSKKARSRVVSRTTSTTNSRTASRTQSRQGSDDEDGNLSDSTNWSVNSIDDMLSVDSSEDTAEGWKQDLGDRMEEIIDRKRSSVQGRETTLNIYTHLLMGHYAYDQLQHKTLELFPALLKSVKADESEKEASLALRAIALTLLTVPSEHMYDGVYQTIKRTYADSESPAVKAVAIHALAAAAIYGGASDSEIEDIMDAMLEIVESDGSSVEAADSGEVVAAACEAWGFLATSIDDMEDKTELAMDAFVDQLESSNTAVQIAAGENIALLFEKSFTEREADDGPASDEEDEEGLPIDSSYVKRYEVYRQKAQLEHTLSQLANESSRRIAKKDRKTLHTNFADILNTVEHPSRGPRYQKAIDQETGKRYGSRMVVRIHKTGSMRIDKWWKLHRLQALRRVLGGGFVVHYESNEVVFDSLPIMILQET